MTNDWTDSVVQGTAYRVFQNSCTQDTLRIDFSPTSFNPEQSVLPLSTNHAESLKRSEITRNTMNL